MYTTALELTRAWLVDPTDPLDSALTCGTRSASDATDVEDGEFRTYAGDRTQLVVRELVTATIPLVLAVLTPQQRTLVHSWKGRLLLLRLIDGTRMFGGYLSVNEKRYYHLSVDGGASGSAYDCTVPFTQVTYDESV